MYFLAGLILGLLVAIPIVLWSTHRTRLQVERLEKRTRGAERLAELGTMTGGLAHEIKNPLSTIGLNLQLLSESIDDLKLEGPENSRIQKRITALSGEVEHLRGILQDFLSFAGRVRLSPQPLELNHVIEDLIDFYTPQADASGIQLRSQLSPDTGSVQIDPTLFKQAILNLLINATQAMVTAKYEESDHGGSSDLIIKTHLPDEKQRNGEDSVIIHVIDTGPGIDEETVSKIFQPYFTTKADGNGLGLATARRIINEHGGHISVHSSEGKGTDFVIELPRRQPASDTDVSSSS